MKLKNKWQNLVHAIRLLLDYKKKKKKKRFSKFITSLVLWPDIEEVLYEMIKKNTETSVMSFKNIALLVV